MIFGNIRNLSEYSFLDSQIQECFAYAKEHDLISFEKGSHEIDGDRLFVNIVEYTTTTPEDRFWEAHREYLDIHVMLDGPEQIDVNFIENMKEEEFQPEKDFLPLQGGANGHVVLDAGDFLVCYPHDAHRTAVKVDEPKLIKKAIFKVKIQ
ncbi:DUF386 domain-containing protein [Clostridium sp. AF19-22AC]|jgi:biofilm protein TabA|uniref:YhcH/YjgK/YiaL family protein n=1 Tax=Clostridia TaxID=186801 RepID=UPI000E4E339B|nr:MULTISPECIES: YhcH/YjgK/YiaL family protein [Clostridia]RHR32886.1 DUF386 domain-containing protein [Clostridium sp. AF19-22AC]